VPTIHRPQLVIVGSGPAGSAAAVRLAARAPEIARDTVMLERRRHPRSKGCGGGLTGRSGPQLQAMGLSPLPPGALPVRHLRLSHGEHATTLLLRAPIPVVRRWQLDALLAARARALVGELREEEPARAIRRDGRWMEVVTDRAVYRTPLVIDASGARCVARRSGLLPRGQRPVPVWVAEGPPGPGEAAWDGEPTLRFDFSEMAHGCPGYYWSFPCFEGGERWVSRGFYPAAGLAPKAARGALARQLLAHGVDPAAVRAVAYPARLFAPGAAHSAPGVLLAGDAAGVDPLFGEGIAQSLEYGALAADAAVRATGRRRPDLHPGDPLRGGALARRLRYLHRMHRELYVPHYQRRLAFALDCTPFLRLVHADTRGALPAPLLWAGMALLALLYRRFARLDLAAPRERSVRV